MIPAGRVPPYLTLRIHCDWPVVENGCRRGQIVEEKIAECAKRIWTLLEDMREVNILRLSEVLSERSVIAYQALGWLARDKKIRYEQRGSQVFISRHNERTSTPPDQRKSRRES